MKIPDIFYHYYAAISEWSQPMRIMINMAVLTLSIYCVLRLTYRFWKPLLLYAGLIWRKLFYLLGSDIYYENRIKAGGNKKYAELRGKQNAFSQRVSEKDGKKHKELRAIKLKKQKLKLRYAFFIYGTALVLLLVPCISNFHWPKPLQAVYKTYNGLEREMLTNTKKFQKAQVRKEKKEQMSEQMEEERTAQEFLQLTQYGESGAYLRKKPDQDSEVTAVLKGKHTMKKIKADDEENPTWFRVKLEDGRKGWIHASLVETEEK